MTFTFIVSQDAQLIQLNLLFIISLKIRVFKSAMLNWDSNENFTTETYFGDP